MMREQDCHTAEDFEMYATELMRHAAIAMKRAAAMHSADIVVQRCMQTAEFIDSAVLLVQRSSFASSTRAARTCVTDEAHKLELVMRRERAAS